MEATKQLQKQLQDKARDTKLKTVPTGNKEQQDEEMMDKGKTNETPGEKIQQTSNKVQSQGDSYMGQNAQGQGQQPTQGQAAQGSQGQPMSKPRQEQDVEMAPANVESAMAQEQQPFNPALNNMT